MSAPAVVDSTPTTGFSAQLEKSRRRKRRPAWGIRLAQLGFLVLILASWEFVSGRLVNSLFISSPSAIARQLWDWILSGVLLTNSVSTFGNAILGLLLGGLVGVIVGSILGTWSIGAKVFEPFITAIYTMPKHALIPVMILWVGVGAELRILTAGLIVFFLVFYNTFFGIRDVSTALVNSVRVMGGSQADLLFRVRLPSAMVWVVAGLKLAVPQAIVGVVVAEMLAGNEGLGYLVAMNAAQFNSAGTFGAIVVLIAFGYVIDRIVTALTRRALQWKSAGLGS